MSKNTNKNLRCVIQKSGRLNEASINLLRNCGVQVELSSRKLKTGCNGFPMEFLFVRDDDIPSYVENGAADIGIVGENVVVEENKDIEIIQRLGFSKCRLSIAVPRDFDYRGVEDLQNKTIATSYPHVVEQFLSENNVDCTVSTINGSVEIAPNIELADVICDLVSTGSTLVANGLKEVQVILNSEAVLVARKDLDIGKERLLDDFLFRVQSYLRIKGYRYVMLNAPTESIESIKDLLPGIKSPTVMPLSMYGWSAVQAVIKENIFWKIVDDLKKLGAEDILLLPIEKMVL
ncbi:MAG: ATP phosphoribosyltransferase [Bacteriovoracaceae bacterium]|nr:ATP phosphoribosyltransferase [Bacteriovoracaceae bacterium]